MEIFESALGVYDLCCSPHQVVIIILFSNWSSWFLKQNDKFWHYVSISVLGRNPSENPKTIFSLEGYKYFFSFCFDTER